MSREVRRFFNFERVDLKLKEIELIASGFSVCPGVNVYSVPK